MRQVFLAAVVCLGAAAWGRAEESVSFYRDVMPIFAKGGCNAGACHGNANGKGGFKLSLRGESPLLDGETLTKNLPSKRVSTDDPTGSFLLRKPAKLVAHDGGEKFRPDSPEYAVILKWIQQGAANDSASASKLTSLEVTPKQQVLEEPNWAVTLQVKVTFADGSQRDVSRWAVYEPSNLLVEVSPEGNVSATHSGETTVIARYLNLQVPVTLAFVPHRPDYVWNGAEAYNGIDKAIGDKLQLLKLNPSGLCGDDTFLRRVYFDVLGIPPTSEEAQSFLNDQTPSREKRLKLVDHLLSRPEYGEQWALRWSDVLRNEEKTVDRRGVDIFWEWLRDSFNNDKPVNQLVTELVTGFGSTYTEAPTNFYRALRDPATRAEAAAQVFLGTRLQCAKCHNHPYEKWTQNDYYRFSALFDGVDYLLLGNSRADKFDKHMFFGEQVVFMEGKRDFKDPRTNKAPTPGFLDPNAPALKPGDDAKRFEKLAEWMTAAENPLFAKVQVNRIWYHLMGRGIVDPVDDFRATNPPSNPALLDFLAVEFVKNGFHVKPLVRLILASRAYQTSSEPDATNGSDEANFSHPKVRRRTAEQLLDAVHQSLDMPTTFSALPKGQHAGQMAGVKRKLRGEDSKLSPDDQFLGCFGKPARLISSELERSNETSLAQIFTLTSGPGIHEMLRAPGNRVQQLLDQSKGNGEQVVDHLYWWILSRPPSDIEKSRLSDEISSAPDRRASAEDVAWALLNTKEFLLRK